MSFEEDIRGLIPESSEMYLPSLFLKCIKLSRVHCPGFAVKFQMHRTFIFYAAVVLSFCE